MMPANCRRVQATGGRCGTPFGDCEGRQRDGGCLLDLVRAAEAAGVRWAFEIDDRLPNLRVETNVFWDYCGDPITA